MEKKVKIYVEKHWLTGESCLFMIENPFEKSALKTKLSGLRKKFVKNLEDRGFTVVYSLDEVDDDTIYLSMEPTAISGAVVGTKEYKELFDERIAEAAGENFNYPTTMDLKDYFETPFFPAVFKNEATNGGDDKFLIETEEQVEKIKEFYEKYKDVEPYKTDFDFVVFQQFLETPSDYKTYLRVLVGGNGEPIGASLKYSARTVSRQDGYSLFENVFLNPESEYYVGAKKMFNYYSGGENINFPQPRYSSEKQAVLKAHGFDPENLEIPVEVLDVCRNIMHNCNPELGVLCGMDFMLNKNDGKWYYLENQAFPAVEEWASRKGVSIPGSHTTKGYMKYLEIELQARGDALELAINENVNQDTTEKVLKKI